MSLIKQDGVGGNASRGYNSPGYYHVLSTSTSNTPQSKLPSLADLIRNAENELKSVLGYACVGASTDEATHFLRVFIAKSVAVNRDSGIDEFSVYGAVLYEVVENEDGKCWVSNFTDYPSSPTDHEYRFDFDLTGRGDVKTIVCGHITTLFCRLQKIR